MYIFLQNYQIKKKNTFYNNALINNGSLIKQYKMVLKIYLCYSLKKNNLKCLITLYNVNS